MQNHGIRSPLPESEFDGLECWPNVDALVIEDGAPVDSIYSERQMRLLTEPLYASWQGPGEGQNFVALANVGIFMSPHSPIVPDMLLSLDIKLPGNPLSDKQFNSYLVWILGKVPDAVAEIVSNREGGEGDRKLAAYARMGIPYYVIWDPVQLLSNEKLRIYALREKEYQLTERRWFPVLNLGLTVWHGMYEGFEDDWLRWCDQQGKVIPTGAEKAEIERNRAAQEKQRAEQAEQRAEQAEQRAESLAAQLRSLGVDLNGNNKNQSSGPS